MSHTPQTTPTVRIHKCDGCTEIFQCPRQLDGECFGCTEAELLWESGANDMSSVHIDFFCISCAEAWAKGSAI